MKFFTKSRLATSLGVLVILATGCAPAAQTPSGASGDPSAPATGGSQKLTIGQASISPTMMPYISICCTQRRYDVFDTVIGQKDDGSVEPMGATSWKLVDDKTWEFTVRNDMKFHDGVAVTPADVAFSINRAIDPVKAKQHLAQAGYANGFKVNIAGQFSSSRELEATTLIVYTCVSLANRSENLTNVLVRVS